LGNTPAVCRKSYVHPAATNAYLNGGLVLDAAKESGGRPNPTALRAEEAAVISLPRSL
jgi:DNA topoisomerase IB